MIIKDNFQRPVLASALIPFSNLNHNMRDTYSTIIHFHENMAAAPQGALYSLIMLASSGSEMRLWPHSLVATSHLESLPLGNRLGPKKQVNPALGEFCCSKNLQGVNKYGPILNINDQI